MKSMKGGFVVDPDVYRDIQAVHFLSQRTQRSQRDFGWWRLFCSVKNTAPQSSFIVNLTLFVNFRAFRGKIITTKYTKNTKVKAMQSLTRRRGGHGEIWISERSFALCNTFFTMKDMKNLKGKFPVNPDVSFSLTKNTKVAKRFGLVEVVLLSEEYCTTKFIHSKSYPFRELSWQNNNHEIH
jgi:hypothetical protein